MSRRRAPAAVKPDILINLGNPILNRSVDGFIKIGAVSYYFSSPSFFFLCYFLFNWKYEARKQMYNLLR
jgi:hypothetical protein